MEAMISREIVNFCAIECRLQMSGELSVAWMVDAWLYAQAITEDADADDANMVPTVTDVLNIGKLVEPNDNALGFRTCGIQIGTDVKMDWENISHQIVNLMEAAKDQRVSAEEFFRAYEEYHPFRDGNGRSGTVLFNWLNGTLDHPVWPPNFWNDPRRTVGYGA